MVASTCVDFYFSHDKAARELGYQPVVSFEQAQAETLSWLKAEKVRTTKGPVAAARGADLAYWGPRRAMNSLSGFFTEWWKHGIE